MKTVKALLTKRRLKFIAVYTAIFAITAVLAFGYFILAEKTFIGSDGIRQHFVAFVYFGKYVRNILKTLLLQHQLVIPGYSFGIGFGGDILQTLNYYVIGDPLNIISVLTPSRYAWASYSFLVVFRLYLAGFAFMLFCREKGVRKPIPLLVGALVYVFAGYSFYYALMHPFFANPMIYLPLLLLFAERVIKGASPVPFSLTVFVSAVSNFYFFYMLVIITVVYIITRLAFLYGKDFRKLFSSFVTVAVSSLAGLLMSAAVLLPVGVAFFSDSRNGSASVDLFYSLRYYLNLPAAFSVSTVAGGEAQTLLGYSSLSLAAVFTLFLQKGKGANSKLLFCIASVLLLLPLTAVVLNGFSYPANRWIWAYGMLVAFIFASQFDALLKLNKKQSALLLALSIAYTLLCFATQQEDREEVLFACACLVIFSAVLLFGGRLRRKTVAIICLILTVSTVAFNGCAYDMLDGSSFVDKFNTVESIQNNFFKALGKEVRSAADDRSFYRYSSDEDSFDYNKDIINNTKGTSFYWSLQNSDIAQFMAEQEMPYTFIYQYQNLDRRVMLNSLLGVKYYCSRFNGRVPYGYSKIADTKLDDNNVYKTNLSLPLCFTYTDCMSYSDYEKLNAVDKQYAMMNTAVFEEIPEGFEASALNTVSVSVPYTVSLDGATLDGNRLITDKEDAVVTFSFDGLPECETYFRFSYDGFEGEKNQQKAELKFTPFINGEAKNKAALSLASFDNDRKDDRQYYTVNLGYSAEGKTAVQMLLKHKGTYDFSDMEIICLPLDEINDIVPLRRSDSISSKVTTDRISISADLSEKRILCLSVPYSKGWSAVVDGEKVPLLRCNTMMSALVLDAGQHEITLTYRTPYLICGAAVSAFGVVSLALIIIYRRKHK